MHTHQAFCFENPSRAGKVWPISVEYPFRDMAAEVLTDVLASAYEVSADSHGQPVYVDGEVVSAFLPYDGLY